MQKMENQKLLKMIKWFKQNGIHVIILLVIMFLVAGLILLLNFASGYGCEQGWHNCSATNMTEYAISW